MKLMTYLVFTLEKKNASVWRVSHSVGEQVFSNISCVEGFGESDAEEHLDSLAYTYDNAFSGSTSSQIFGVDLTPDTADSLNTSQESRPEPNGMSESVNSNSSSPGADGGSSPHVMVQGVNLALVKTTTTYPDGSGGTTCGVWIIRNL